MIYFIVSLKWLFWIYLLAEMGILTVRLRTVVKHFVNRQI